MRNFRTVLRPTNLEQRNIRNVLIDGGRVIRQSLAIIEYLEEVYDGNHLLPGTARERARARGLAHLIATDISPLGNLSVLQYLEQEDGMPQIERERWVRTWIERGFAAFEEMLADNPSTGDFFAQFPATDPAQSVYVGDELNLVFHGGQEVFEALFAVLVSTISTAAAAHSSSTPARRMTLSGLPPSSVS